MLNAEDLFRRAEQCIGQSRFQEGFSLLDRALELDPGYMPTVKLLRRIERVADEGYRKWREDAALKELQTARGTKRWSHVVRKQAALWNAPRVMRCIKEAVEREEISPRPRQLDPGEPPRVSLVIPAYNRERSLSQTVDSVLRQTRTDWEMILVDDCSTDRTGEVMKEIRTRHPDRRIRVIHLPENVGIGAVRNRGVREARGEFIVLLDSDDTIAPRFLEKTVKAADRRPEAAWIAPMTVQYGDVNRLFGFEPFTLERQLTHNLYNITMLLRREVWGELGGFREDMREGYVDWEFWTRAILTGFRAHHLFEVLFFYRRVNDGSISDDVAEDREREFRCKLQIVQSNPEAYLPLGEQQLKLLKEHRWFHPDLLNRTELPRLESRAVKRAASAGIGCRTDDSVKSEVVRSADESGPVVSTHRAKGEGMKALFVCHDFPPHRFAGAQLYALNLARAMKQRGVDVEIYHPVFRGEYPPDYETHRESYEGLTVYKVSKNKSPEREKLYNHRIEKAFADFLNRHPYDLIHFHGLGQLSAAPVHVAKRLGYRTVMTLHDFWFLCDRWHLVRPDQSVCSGPENARKCAECYLSGFNRMSTSGLLDETIRYKLCRDELFHKTFDLIDMAMAPSRFIIGKFDGCGFRDIIHNPYGFLPIEAVPKIPRRDIVFGFVGQIISRKGVDVLVEAFKHPFFARNKLLIFGGRYEDSYGRRFLESIKGVDNIEYHGIYQPQDLPGIMSRIDIACVPSRMDNHPLTVYEAFLNKTPVIASDAGGIPEMIEDGNNGLLFDCGSPESLSGRMKTVVDNPELLETFRQNIPKIKTMAEDAEFTLDKYRELIGQRDKVDINQWKSDKNPRIVVVQGGFPSTSATFILDQMTGLIDRGFELENWATYRPRQSVVHDDISRYKLLERTRYIKFPPENIQADINLWVERFCQLNQIEDFDDVDAFHVHYGPNFNFLQPLFRHLDKFVLVSFHGYDASRYFRLNGDDCYRFLFERADLITTPSHYMKNELVRRGCSPDKVRVHRYGVNLDKFRSEQTRPAGSPVTLLTVARLVEKKGIEYAIRAVAKMSDRLNLRYRIVGDGPLRNSLEELTLMLGIDEQVKFLGECNKDEVAREMSAADIFVLTSVTAEDGDQEGVPVSLIEAHAVGLPVISSYHTGIPELVIDGETGLLAEEKDANKITENISKLVENNQLRVSFSQKARRRVKDEFNIMSLNDTLADYLRQGVEDKADKKMGAKDNQDSKALRLDSENKGWGYKCERYRKSGEARQYGKSLIPEIQDNRQSTIDNRKVVLEKALSEKDWSEKLPLYDKVFDGVVELRKVKSPSASIVVISWRLHPDTRINFQMLELQREEGFELIFVDNGGKQGEFDELKPFINIYVRLNSNTGAYLARNIGAIFAKAPLLIFLEDDGIPWENFVHSHLEAHHEFDTIAVRGVYIPKTGNPLNKIAKHYYLGEQCFPIFADVEGNVSYDAAAFYRVKGWDDDIRFGGGGFDLSLRLVDAEPDMRKQIYSPHPRIYHDYVRDDDHLHNKRGKQERSRQYLHNKHPDYDRYLKSWKRLRGREDLLIRKRAPFDHTPNSFRKGSFESTRMARQAVELIYHRHFNAARARLDRLSHDAQMAPLAQDALKRLSQIENDLNYLRHREDLLIPRLSPDVDGHDQKDKPADLRDKIEILGVPINLDLSSRRGLRETVERVNRYIGSGKPILAAKIVEKEMGQLEECSEIIARLH